jgi:hypothetical protein
MKSNINIYGQELNQSVIKDVNEINEKIKNETDPEKLLNLHLQRLYRGMELNSATSYRSHRPYYPY